MIAAEISSKTRGWEMYRGNRIAVVVPAYNEEQLITETLTTIPEYVDKIYAVNDGSSDDTAQIIDTLAERDSRIIPIHQKNQGVGSAIVSGYNHSLDDRIDITAVMAGDNQMDPAHLPSLLDPIVDGDADYTKGNRLYDSNFKKGMSVWRLTGNTMLTVLTKFSSGCYNVSDPQNGYTAISKRALLRIDPNQIFTWYGYCNDMIMRLRAKQCRILDVSIPARYGTEKSKIKYPVYMARISRLLVRNFITRLAIKRADGNKAQAFLSPLLGSTMAILGSIIILLMTVGTVEAPVGPYHWPPSIVLFSLPFIGITILLYNRVINVAAEGLRRQD